MKTENEIRDEYRAGGFSDADRRLSLEGILEALYLLGYKSAQSSMEAEIQKLKNHIDWQESRLEKERKDNDESRSLQTKMIDKLLSKCDALEAEIDRRANKKVEKFREALRKKLRVEIMKRSGPEAADCGSQQRNHDVRQAYKHCIQLLTSEGENQ